LKIELTKIEIIKILGIIGKKQYENDDVMQNIVRHLENILVANNHTKEFRKYVADKTIAEFHY
jgi:hypothetical protein